VLAGFYRDGQADFPKDRTLANTWGFIGQLVEAEASGDKPRLLPENILPSDQARIAWANVKLVMDQCARAREAVLVKERPRWAELTKQLRQELAPLAQVVEQERRAERRARLPWWQRMFDW
jgi:hypothetical protein